MSKLTVFIIAGVTTLFVIGAGIFAGYQLLSSPSSPTYHGTYFEPNGEPKDFTLVSADDGEVSMSDYQGQVVAIYFGYTHCPDICPATLAKLDQAKEQLGDQAEDLQIMMVTVDPQRDTPERLQEFVTQFNPGFVSLGGSAEQVEQATSEIGINVQKQEGSVATGYLIDHTSHVVVLGRQGQVRLLLPFDLTSQQIAEDLKQLL